MNKKLYIILIITILFIASNIVAIFYVLRPSDQHIEEKEEELIKRPKDRFLEFKNLLENIETYDEIVELAEHYISETIDTEIMGYEQIELSEEEKKQLIVILKSMPPLIQDIEDISEEIDNGSGKLMITTKDNHLCYISLFLEENQWKFGIAECKEIVDEQPFETFIDSAIVSCGSIKWINIMNMEGERTLEEDNAINCMIEALINCEPKALTVKGIQERTYQIENKQEQYCNISIKTMFKRTCRVPLDYILTQQQRYKGPSKNDLFLNSIISSIDVGGKTVDGITGETIINFICQE